MGAKILIVDDSDFIRRIVTMALERGGYEVIAAENGQAALALLEAQPCDAVISDINMPDMTGLEMLSKLRASGNQKIPALMLTTETASSLRDQGAAAGVKEWLVKPFRPEELIAAVQRVLGV